MIGLIGAQAREPCDRVQVLECALHRLDLVQVEVLLHAVVALVPELTVERFLSRLRHGRGVAAQVEVVAELRLLAAGELD